MGCRIVKSVCKTAAEQKLWGFDYAGFDEDLGAWGFLARVWRPGTIYAGGVVIRPSVPNGYQYAVTVTGQGQSGSVEPRWPTTIGQTVTDGSLVWECEEVSDASLSATIVSSVWTADAGVTLTDQLLEAGAGIQRASVQVSGGVVNRRYEVSNLVELSDGSIEQSILRVQVE